MLQGAEIHYRQKSRDDNSTQKIKACRFVWRYICSVKEMFESYHIIINFIKETNFIA